MNATAMRGWLIVVLVLLAPLPYGMWVAGCEIVSWWRGPVALLPSTTSEVVAPPLRVRKGMVSIPSGEFVMGDARRGPPDRRPAHVVWLAGYWVDRHLVTNAEFRRFVEATGYVTTAEVRGRSLVFDTVAGKWQELPEACWHRPGGKHSSLVGSDDLPVVHVSWDDAQAYATWSGKRLLTEAEYERAARGGLLDARYAWGDDPGGEGEGLANYWQGSFPAHDRGLDGWRGLSPVGTFPPNRFGLYDMAGNVWCWCSDWYGEEYYTVSDRENPQGPAKGVERVLRGGSWLSTIGTPDELAVGNRGRAVPDHTASNIGFRCASSLPPK